MTSPAKRRPMINRLLRDLTPSKWISVEELNRLALSRADYSFVMTNYGWKLYFSDPHYGHIDLKSPNAGRSSAGVCRLPL